MSKRVNCFSRSTPNHTKPRCVWAKPKWSPMKPSSSSPSRITFEPRTCSRTRGGIQQQEFDQYKATLDQSLAQLDASKANLDIYRLNLQYTRVTSPIDGQVSRYFLTVGNLINQDQTLLTTVVSLDPIYAYYDVDQRTLLRIRSAINEGKLPSRRASARTGPELPREKILATQAALTLTNLACALPATVTALGLAALNARAGPAEIPVLLGMPGDNKFPYNGFINFANNQLNPNTGSVVVRGVFANPKPPNGVRLMSPGMFVRIRLFATRAASTTHSSSIGRFNQIKGRSTFTLSMERTRRNTVRSARARSRKTASARSIVD